MQVEEIEEYQKRQEIISKILYELKIEEYGKKPLWLRIKRLFKTKRGFIPLYISQGCFKGSMRELLA